MKPNATGPHIALGVVIAGDRRRFEPGDTIPVGVFNASQAEALERACYILHVSSPGARFFKPGVPFNVALRALQDAQRTGAHMTSPIE